MVSWPSGVDGFQPELAALCHIAQDWPEFASHVVRVLRSSGQDWFSAKQKQQIRQLLSPDHIYGPLLQYLDGYYGQNVQPRKDNAVAKGGR
jgi:hypothetical protein